MHLCAFLLYCSPRGAPQGYNGAVDAPRDVFRLFRKSLEAAAPAVLNFLTASVTTAFTQLTTASRLLECFASWTRHCSIPSAFMATCPLV